MFSALWGICLEVKLLVGLGVNGTCSSTSPINKMYCAVLSMVVHTCNPNAQEAEAGGT
jgi:hypothetical protein